MRFLLFLMFYLLLTGCIDDSSNLVVDNSQSDQSSGDVNNDTAVEIREINSYDELIGKWAEVKSFEIDTYNKDTLFNDHSDSINVVMEIFENETWSFYYDDGDTYTKGFLFKDTAFYFEDYNYSEYLHFLGDTLVVTFWEDYYEKNVTYYTSYSNSYLPWVQIPESIVGRWVYVYSGYNDNGRIVINEYDYSGSRITEFREDGMEIFWSGDDSSQSWYSWKDDTIKSFKSSDMTLEPTWISTIRSMDDMLVFRSVSQIGPELIDSLEYFYKRL